ncbi:MAG: hypothetical protein KKC11_06020 [Candidatus Omnitrophica bacterium]|nr:hypothetical protein [Candidatus Omnitrophota bacterium]MBU0878656.1 hypothetical protein [Candidatus Omnitrophota bacterium]MBU0897287.1 hypothetical protein [Candidatus Omnitrophota bacterium]MBU1133610.1 hypothetical protein [Candidatus Omnitrophota bacterium]MBU1367104.1 hypothetical protein [Candidatus Omnitrophota bacterium]
MKDFDKLKKFKHIYLHPHGLGDLIISMPYIRRVMSKNLNFALCVKDDVYNCGFFNNFNFRDKVFPWCPSIWNNSQTIKSFRKINKLTRALKKENINTFYLLFNKKENRRLQICEGLSRKLGQQISFKEDIHGEVYLSDKDISSAHQKLKKEICFLHTRSGSSLKSVIPGKLIKYIDLGEFSLFSPFQTNNINLIFAAQLLSKKNVVVDSIYMHSAAALNRDIDILFVSASVKRFFNTLKPTNIKIHKVIYGNFFDAIKAFAYYDLRRYFKPKNLERR